MPLTLYVQVTRELDHEETVLQNLAMTTSKQKSVLHDIEENIMQSKSDLEDIKRNHQDKFYQVETLEKQLEEVTNKPHGDLS